MPGARGPLYQVSKLRTLGGVLWAFGRRFVHTADAEEIHISCGAEAQLAPLMDKIEIVCKDEV